MGRHFWRRRSLAAAEAGGAAIGGLLGSEDNASDECCAYNPGAFETRPTTPGHVQVRAALATGLVPKMLLAAETVVQPGLKTHRYGGHFTLSLKNAVGFAGNAGAAIL